MPFIDLRKQMPSLDSLQLYELYFFPRPSSQHRLLFNTAIIGFCGFFYGIGLALKKQKSTLIKSSKFCAFALTSGYLHVQLNEMATGIMIRNYGIDQYWITNTAAGIINCTVIYTGMTIMNSNSASGKLITAQKRAGSICLISMLLDGFAQLQRYIYINKLAEMKQKQ